MLTGLPLWWWIFLTQPPVDCRKVKDELQDKPCRKIQAIVLMTRMPTNALCNHRSPFIQLGEQLSYRQIAVDT